MWLTRGDLPTTTRRATTSTSTPSASTTTCDCIQHWAICRPPPSRRNRRNEKLLACPNVRNLMSRDDRKPVGKIGHKASRMFYRCLAGRQSGRSTAFLAAYGDLACNWQVPVIGGQSRSFRKIHVAGIRRHVWLHFTRTRRLSLQITHASSHSKPASFSQDFWRG
jgi:hypothetical protein